GDEAVADHVERHVVQLARNAHPALGHRPETRELVAHREEPVARGGAGLAEKRQALDAVVDVASAHASAVDEERYGCHEVVPPILSRARLVARRSSSGPASAWQRCTSGSMSVRA